MSLKGKSDIFESIAQHYDGIADDPAVIRLISDRVLIRDLGEQEQIGSIVIPEVARKPGTGSDTLRTGVVVAVGPGDRFIEMGVSDEGEVRRKLITGGDCAACNGHGKYFDIQTYETNECPHCYGGGKEPLTIPPQCQPGDKVLYSRRAEAEIFLGGVRYTIINAEQSAYAVLTED